MLTKRMEGSYNRQIPIMANCYMSPPFGKCMFFTSAFIFFSGNLKEKHVSFV
jgi:hypothetical protein